MWKKLGNLQKQNRKTFRSHFHKAEVAFKTFHNGLNDSIKSSNKQHFCEDYISRHHSADKHHQVKLTKDQSSKSLITLSHQDKKQNSNIHQDFFSAMRNQDSSQKKIQINIHSAVISDSHPEQSFGDHRKLLANKCSEAQRNLSSLKKQQIELKHYLSDALGKTCEDIKNIAEQITKSIAKKTQKVSQALEKVRKFRAKQNDWSKQKERILQKHNLRLQNLI